MDTKNDEISSGLLIVRPEDHPDFIGGIVWSRLELDWINTRISDAERIIAAKVLALEAEIGAKRAQIDSLMWEYCPNEMTPEQIEEYARHQRAATPEEQKEIDAAMQEDKP